MMESLAHKQLKTEARKILKEKYDFKDNKIIEEYVHILKNSVKVKIDVVGKRGEKIIAVECGNTSKLKQVSLGEEFGNENVVILPYDEVVLKQAHYMNPKTRKEKIMLLKSIYNEFIYEPLKDDKDFSLLQYEQKNADEFYIGKKIGIWMAFPTRKSTSIGKNLQFEINFTISLVEDNFFEIAVNAETNESVRQVLNLSNSTNKNIIDELIKLPSEFETQDGIKFYDVHQFRPMKRNWEITEPVPCNQMGDDSLSEMHKRLEWYLSEGKKFKEYPIFVFSRVKIRKEELVKTMLLLKPLYLLSFNFKTKDRESEERNEYEKLIERKRMIELGLSNEDEGDYKRICEALAQLRNN